MAEAFSKHKKILVTILLLNIGLVATHEGEFWPFSIYPMFSQAGKQWSRGLVERVSDTSAVDLWQTKPLNSIKGRVLPLQQYNIHEIDFANYINKTYDWDEKRLNGLRSTFRINNYSDQMWLATRVTGYLTEADTVAIEAIPLFLFTPDTTIKNPYLFTD